MIAEKRQEDLDVKEAIAEEKKKTRKQIEVLDNEIHEVQQETQMMKTKYQEKIKLARSIQDKILHERVQTQGLLKIFQQKNQLLYFYPVKIRRTKEDLDQKKAELELYQQIINRTFGFIQEKMQENRQKHALVHELNDYVSQSVQEMLEQEREFFDSDTKDKLKVPPFTKVKRIPRDYTNEE